jgi:hypothetical protein
VDYKHSDATSRLAEVRESIRGGNWDAAESFSQSLADCPLPLSQHGLAEYLDALKATIIVAKAARSVAASSLARVRAAAKFQSNCQNPGEATDFSRPASSPSPVHSTT